MLTAKAPRARRLPRSALAHTLTALWGGAGLCMSGEGGGSPRPNLFSQVLWLPLKLLWLPFKLVNVQRPMSRAVELRPLFHVLI